MHPSFLGRLRNIPQRMLLDVQPLVKSLFCATKQSPNGFFDFEASIPLKLDFLLGGEVCGGVGVGGGEFELRRIRTRIGQNRAD